MTTAMAAELGDRVDPADSGTGRRARGRAEVMPAPVTSAQPVVGEDVDQVGVVGDHGDRAAARPAARPAASPAPRQVARVLAEGRLVEHEHPRARWPARWPPTAGAAGRRRACTGWRRRTAVRPSRSSSSSAVARAARGVLAGAQRPEGELVAQPAGEELLLGVLEDRADPADQLAGPPAVRRPVRPAQPGGERRRRRRPGRWSARAARRAAARGWTCPVPFGPGDGERAAGPQRGVGGRQRRDAAARGR